MSRILNFHWQSGVTVVESGPNFKARIILKYQKIWLHIDISSLRSYWQDQERQNYHFLAYLSIHRHDKMYVQYQYYQNNAEMFSNCNLLEVARVLKDEIIWLSKNWTVIMTDTCHQKSRALTG